MALYWLTSYPGNPNLPVYSELVGLFGSFIEAETERKAKVLAKKRGLGEKVVGFARSHDITPPSMLIECRDKIKFLHAACFLGYMAMQSKVCEPWEVVGDQGIVHEAIHRAMGLQNKARLKQELLRIEGLVPGYPKKRTGRRKFR